MAKVDRIFNKTGKVSDFSFNRAVADVFDDMVVRSVPFYTELQRMIGEMAQFFFKPRTFVYDFGCATGTTLMFLMNAIRDPTAQFVGVDNSQAMLDKARVNVNKLSRKSKVSFLESDLNKPTFKASKISVATMNWTLQFVRPIYREALLERIHDAMTPGGALLICEKIIVEATELNRMYIENYYAFKKRNGYSELEIAKKREALENVLLPCTVNENVELLRGAGFAHVDTFFRWYNWAGFIAVK
jgi:tRNA (cmo5U34)-methyltransferase